MSKHQERQAARIIQAALIIVQRDGFSQLSMSCIAEEAGLTRQTIYNYFPDVESIVSAAVDQHILAMETHLLAVMDAADGFENKLLVVTEFLFVVAASDHQQVSLEMGLSAEHRQRISQQNNTIKSHLRASFAETFPGVEAKGSQSPEAVIDILWGMIEGAAEASREHVAEKGELLSLVNRALNSALTIFCEREKL